MALTIQYVMYTYLFLIVRCNITLGIGCIMHVFACCEDIKINLSSIHENGHRAENRSNISIQLSEFVRYHAEMKQLNRHYIIVKMKNYF